MNSGIKSGVKSGGGLHVNVGFVGMRLIREIRGSQKSTQNFDSIGFDRDVEKHGNMSI